MKILVIFTGGTIGSTKSGGIISPSEKNSFLLLDMYSKTDSKTEFVSVQPYNILSENLACDNLIQLYNCIKSFDENSFDGIIVTHGTDTLQYTSAFLSYSFGLSATPIVVVSANYPLADERSNGLDNFTAAVDFIKSKSGNGVFVAYKNKHELPKIHRASRILPHLPYTDNVTSIFNQPYGTIENHTFFKNNSYTEQSDKFSFCNPTKNINCRDVIKISPYPGVSYPDIDESIKAVLLESYHSGTIATQSRELQSFCKKASELNIPVFLTGSKSGFLYESKLLFEKLNIKVLPASPPQSMLVKLLMLERKSIGDVFLPCGGDFA